MCNAAIISSLFAKTTHVQSRFFHVSSVHDLSRRSAIVIVAPKPFSNHVIKCLTRDRFDRQSRDFCITYLVVLGQSHWLPCLRLHVAQSFSIFFVFLESSSYVLILMVEYDLCSWDLGGHISHMNFTDGSSSMHSMPIFAYFEHKKHA